MKLERHLVILNILAVLTSKYKYVNFCSVDWTVRPIAEILIELGMYWDQIEVCKVLYNMIIRLHVTFEKVKHKSSVRS